MGKSTNEIKIGGDHDENPLGILLATGPALDCDHSRPTLDIAIFVPNADHG